MRENNLKDAKSIEDAFITQIKDVAEFQGNSDTCLSDFIAQPHVLQEALEEELTHELGYSKYDWKNKQTANSWNGHTKKTVRSRFGPIDLKIPRDICEW